MQIIAKNLAALIVDAALLARVTDLFAAVEQERTGGGMTLGLPLPPIVVCHGRPSLADEKALRSQLQQLNPQFKLSRFSSEEKRIAQYDVAANVTTFKRIVKRRTGKVADEMQVTPTDNVNADVAIVTDDGKPIDISQTPDGRRTPQM